MLESSSLSLEWTTPPGVPNGRHAWTPGQRVVIRNADARAVLGVAQVSDRPASWFRRGRELDVLEGDDQALLFTIRRYWFITPFWLVDDAEGCRVGNIKSARAGLYQFDRTDSPITRVLSERESGVLAESLPGVEARVVSPSHSVLANLHLSGGQTFVQFGSGLKDDPFARMLVLATALLWRR